MTQNQQRRQRGFTLMELVLSLIIFTMMTLMFGAVLPVAVHGAQHGDNYSQAAAIAQRKIDQLRAAGFNRLFDGGGGSALAQLSAQNVVDGQIGPTNPAGGTYDFTTIDHLTGAGGFFPAGSTGTITINNSYNGVPAGNVAQITVTINWTGTVPGNYTVSALIISMSHQ